MMDQPMSERSCLVPTLTVETETGSTYTFAHDPCTGFNLVRRTRQAIDEGALRRDGEWLRVLLRGSVEVGYPIAMMLEPLGEGAVVTERVTSNVVSVMVS